MNVLPDCPLCGRDGLRMMPYTAPSGLLHYRLECDMCGARIEHDDFIGHNAVMAFAEGFARPCREDCGAEVPR